MSLVQIILADPKLPAAAAKPAATTPGRGSRARRTTQAGGPKMPGALVLSSKELARLGAGLATLVKTDGIFVQTKGSSRAKNQNGRNDQPGRRTVAQEASTASAGVQTSTKTRDAAAVAALLAAGTPFAAIMGRLQSEQGAVEAPKAQTVAQAGPTTLTRSAARDASAIAVRAAVTPSDQKPSSEGAQAMAPDQARIASMAAKLLSSGQIQLLQSSPAGVGSAGKLQAEESQKRASAGDSKGKVEMPGASQAVHEAKSIVPAGSSDAQVGGMIQVPDRPAGKRAGSPQVTATTKQVDGTVSGLQVTVATIVTDGNRPSALDHLSGGASDTAMAGKGDSSPVGLDKAALGDALGQTAQVPVLNQVTARLRESALRLGQQIVIRLNPPQLGAVRLTLQADGKDVRGTLEVDNSRVLGELQREAPSLINRLADGGVQVRRLDITLNDRGSSDSGNPMPQYSASNPHQESWRQGQDASSRPLLPADSGPAEMDVSPRALSRADGGSLNVMI